MQKRAIYMNNFLWCPKSAIEKQDLHNTLVNVSVDLLVFTHIAGTS